MAPKKKEAQKMSLGDFLNDSSFGGSWADEVEDTIGTQPLPAPEHARGGMSMGGYGGYGGDRGDRGYAPRDSGPQQLPTRPPYTAHLGNLPYDATMDGDNDFFADCGVVSVRIIEDRELQRPKGFAYVEFSELDGLKKALELDGESFNGRYIKVKIADPPRDRGGGDSGRDLSDWTRKGPLADLPRGNDRRDFGERRQVDFGERRAPREPADDGKVRDFGNWERKGPLSPLPQPEAPPMSREGSRARSNANNADSLRNRHQSPSWGEGRPEGSGSRPPHREFREKPERVPTAAERDMQWRSNMRAGPQNASPSQSREGSETPASPSQPPAALATRPKLNLTKRTVSEAPDVPSPATAGDSKSNPFGGARPIDTMTREREIEEKRQQAIKEKREAEEKAKEDRRLAKEAAAKEAAAKAEAEAEAEASAAAATTEAEPQAEGAADESADAPKESGEAAKSNEQKPGNGASKEQRLPARSREPREPREPKEGRADPKSRATESGNWRQSSGEHRAPRGAPSGPRRGGGARGGRNDGARGSRSNGAGGQQPPATPVTAEPATPTQDEDGWTTVTIPKSSRRGGQGRVA